MICDTAYRFCCQDIKLIENYEKAVNDTTQVWHCHHRLETCFNLSKNELIERGLYENRPADELIFLTKQEHANVHKQAKLNIQKEKIPKSFSYKYYKYKVIIGEKILYFDNQKEICKYLNITQGTVSNILNCVHKNNIIKIEKIINPIIEQK